MKLPLCNNFASYNFSHCFIELWMSELRSENSTKYILLGWSLLSIDFINIVTFTYVISDFNKMTVLCESFINDNNFTMLIILITLNVTRTHASLIFENTEECFKEMLHGYQKSMQHRNLFFCYIIKIWRSSFFERIYLFKFKFKRNY